MMGRPGSFEKIVQDGVDALSALRKLESERKLSVEGFLRASVEIAGATQDRIEACAKRLDDGTSAPAARRFCRTIATQYRTPHFSEPYPHPSKALRIWGDEESGIQLNEMRVTVAEALAVGALWATQRWPEAFGSCDSAAAHARAIKSAKETLDELYDKLRATCGIQDLILEHVSLSPSEREAGHAIVSFRAFPEVRFSPDWPQRLVEAAAAQRQAGMVSEEPEPVPSPRKKVKRVQAGSGAGALA